MATDIAFVLGIVGALGASASTSGRIFLTALAVVDDVGAILVIALFYSSGTSIPYLIAAALIVVAMSALNRSGRVGPWPVFALGVALWACALGAGVHPTLAGLATGLLLPERAGTGELTRIEHAVEPWVSRAIVPLFALANAGVALSGGSSLVTDRVALGVFFGLVVGKPVGIMAATFVTARLAPSVRASVERSRSLLGFSMLGGIGFTMSLFIAELAFGDSPHADAARIGILSASVVAAASGFTILRRSTPNEG